MNDVANQARDWAYTLGRGITSEVLVRAAVEIERLEQAVDILRRLEEPMRMTLSTGGEPNRCIFCLSIKNTYDEIGRRKFHHEADCPLVDAFAFLATLDWKEATDA